MAITELEEPPLDEALPLDEPDPPEDRVLSVAASPPDDPDDDPLDEPSLPDDEPELLALAELEPPPAASGPEASADASSTPLPLIVQSESSAGHPVSTTGSVSAASATEDARIIGGRSLRTPPRPRRMTALTRHASRSCCSLSAR